MRVLQTLENPRHLGPITSLLVDKKRAWVLVGTAAGFLALWDLRFGLRVRAWQVGPLASVTGDHVSVVDMALHPTRGKARHVVVALQSRVDTTSIRSRQDTSDGVSTQAEVWDIERGTLVERFVSLQPGASVPSPPTGTGIPSSNADETTPAAAIAALVKARQAGADAYVRPSNAGTAPVPPSAEARTLLLGTDLGGASHRGEMVVDLAVDGVTATRRRGFMITGAEDRRIRLWDLAKTESSTLLSTPPADGGDERPVYASS
jgi:phosphoinositide-3-kinase regulatory subunit 4